MPILARNVQSSEDLAEKIYDLVKLALTPEGILNDDLQKRIMSPLLERVGRRETTVGKFFDFACAARPRLLALSYWRPTRLGRRCPDTGQRLANDYFTLLQLDLQLHITHKTVATQTDSVKLTKLRLEHGVATKLDVLQAQQVLDTANAQIPDLELEIGTGRKRDQHPARRITTRCSTWALPSRARASSGSAAWFDIVTP